MIFAKERVDVITNELAGLITVQNCPINTFEYKKGFYVNPAEADGADVPYAPFHCETDTWAGPDEHYWFRTELTVPESFDGKPLWLYFCTDRVYWDAVNPQFLLFLNEKPIQGVDINHREVLVTRCAKAGETYRLDLQAYTGRDTHEHVGEDFNLELKAAFMERNPEIDRLYYNLTIPNEIVGWLEKDNMSRIALEKALNETINLIDLREPYSPEFYASIDAANEYVEQKIYTELAGHDEVIATCIGHTHIDVAWWWTVSQTREKAARSFSTVLKLMDEYPNYKFMSSQPQLYAFVKERYPDLFERIKERVAEGRWEVEGGMWLEADCNLISGESMVRQFLHGKRFFKEEFGKDNKILWLPDVFGYSAALPQIMKKSGIDYFMTTKIAWNQFNKLPMDTFWWKGIDGSEVFTHLITTQDAHQAKDSHYTTYNGYLNATSVIRAWERYQQKEFANDVLLSCGYGDGGGGTTRPMAENAERLSKGITGAPKVRWETSRKYFDELFETCGKNEKLPRWVGELYLEYHRGTYTSQAYNKKANRRMEFLLRSAEAAVAAAACRGRDMEQPRRQLEQAWKIVLCQQFHDIIPGSSIGSVYEDSHAFYAQAESLARQALEAAAQPSGEQGLFTVWNNANWHRSSLVELEGDFTGRHLRLEDGTVPPQALTQGGAVALLPLPALNTVKLLVKDGPAPEAPACATLLEHGLETALLRLEWDENGQLTSIYDKREDRELVPQGRKANAITLYEDRPRNYDAWELEYSHRRKGWGIGAPTAVTVVENNPLRAVVEFRYRFGKSQLVQRMTAYAHTARVDFSTWVDWQERELVMKADFPVDIHSNRARFDIQFGSMERPTTKNTSWEFAKFESVGHKWADYAEPGYGAALLNDCKYGYDIHDGVMSLTLLKASNRPDDHADQGTHTFTYALFPHSGEWYQAAVDQEAWELNDPPLVFQGETAPLGGLWQGDVPGVTFDAIKVAEDGGALILRFHEKEGRHARVSFQADFQFQSWCPCNLLERQEGQPHTQRELSFTLRPFELKTIKIKL